MKSLILVSRGKFTEGLKTSLDMFAGDAINRVRALHLYNGESADDFKKKVSDSLDKQNFNSEDESMVLADITGGSPLTTFLSVFSGRGLVGKNVVLSGMSFTMASTATVPLDTASKEDIAKNTLDKIRQALEQYKIISGNNSGDSDDI